MYFAGKHRWFPNHRGLLQGKQTPFHVGVKTPTIPRMELEIDPLALEVAQELTVDDERKAQTQTSATWEHQELAQVTIQRI